VISGIVQSDEGCIRLIVQGPEEGEQEIEGVIDTGYTGALSLPSAVVAALGLRWQTSDRGILADGSECLFDVYEGAAVWDGKVRRLLIDEADADPLIGMTLLRGYELKMQIGNRGKITIKPLTTKRNRRSSRGG
jgi:clan AA aspartic protease